MYGEITGYGNNCDAYHYTAPSLGGDVQAKCITALRPDAGISTDDVDYINAHGTATRLNDAAETMAIKALFGDAARKLAISSNKSCRAMLGSSGGSGSYLHPAHTEEWDHPTNSQSGLP